MSSTARDTATAGLKFRSLIRQTALYLNLYGTEKAEDLELSDNTKYSNDSKWYLDKNTWQSF